MFDLIFFYFLISVANVNWKKFNFSLCLWLYFFLHSVPSTFFNPCSCFPFQCIQSFFFFFFSFEYSQYNNCTTLAEVKSSRTKNSMVYFFLYCFEPAFHNKHRSQTNSIYSSFLFPNHHWVTRFLVTIGEHNVLHVQ